MESLRIELIRAASTSVRPIYYKDPRMWSKSKGSYTVCEVFRVENWELC